MMARKAFAALAASLVLSGCAEKPDPDRLVVRTDFDVPAGWTHRTLGGHDFLPMFAQHYWADAHCTNAPLPMYRECVVQTGGGDRKLFRNDICENGDAHVGNYARWLRPEEKRTEPYALKDVCGRPLSALRGQYADGGTGAGSKEEYPFFLQLREDRPSFFLKREYPLADRASYWAWRAEHPNFIGVHTLGEYDQQAMWYEAFSGKNKDQTVTQYLRKSFPFADKKIPYPIRQRDTFPKWVRECYAREQAFYFGETNLWTLCSGCPSLQHIMGEMGACGFSYEATTQGAASWTIPGAFTRGAARQFGVPFGWYGANFLTGYTRDGKYGSGENSMALVPDRHYKAFGKYKGASRSIIRRQLTYGWLIGAALIDPENWYHYHMEEFKVKDADGKERVKAVPSVYAKDMQELIDRAKTMERGNSYTPLAVLVPVWERFVQGYWNRDLCDPWSLNAVLMTLDSGVSEVDPKARTIYDLARRHGNECCFFNSPFGGIYDIIAPDATRNRANIQTTLGAYKAAIVAGDFRKAELPTCVFEDYAARGGTLFVSGDKIEKGVVNAGAAGVTFGKKTVSSGKKMVPVHSSTSTSNFDSSTPLSSSYDIMVPEGTPTAKPLYVDELGNVLVWAKDYGRGRIVTVACDRMLPSAYAKCTHGDYKTKLYEAAQPGFRFEIIRTLLEKIQDETMPVKVDGDIMWGVNRVKVRGDGDGWMVWLFNNKGVTKFIGEQAEIDASKASVVTVRRGRTAKTVTVAPGAVEYVTFED